MQTSAVTKIHTVALLLLVASSSMARTHSGSHESRSLATERGLAQAARARQQAYARGDCVNWAGYVSDDFHFIDQAGRSFTRDQEMKECELPHSVAGPTNERVLSDFHCQIKGNLAFLDYRVDETQVQIRASPPVLYRAE